MKYSPYTTYYNGVVTDKAQLDAISQGIASRVIDSDVNVFVKCLGTSCYNMIHSEEQCHCGPTGSTGGTTGTTGSVCHWQRIVCFPDLWFVDVITCKEYTVKNGTCCCSSKSCKHRAKITETECHGPPPCCPNSNCQPSSTSAYLYAYNDTAQVVIPNGALPFTGTGPINGFTLVLGTGNIIVQQAGVYVVDFTVCAASIALVGFTNQFGLMLNDVAVPSTVYGIRTDSANNIQNYGHAIVTVTAGQKLTIQNMNNDALLLINNIGGFNVNVSGSVTVHKIA